ncbi:polysaccharide export protein [Sphingomonas sp. QA11]|uniref:polysaccharide biosynthesis/export family protein n=1 Tax=Sphingomonas sp. QA11 TaxID=2950605 RepID=UPI00234A4FDC|nr:polysaccharide biosynthesis/export family protein [Sphingomonas sp. QA11]WCM29728.1 polysaccharide export protein [Sphingomonas sp. QA11]
MLSILMGGCSTLPSSGPTAGEISRAQQKLDGFDLIEVEESAISQIMASPSTGRGRIAAVTLPGEVDTIGPGDVLQISIYEVGSALFGARAASMGFTPASGSGENLPPVTVGRDGRITLPWVGRITAIGKTVDELADELTQAYHRNSENPQVMVSIRENVNNTVIVQGDVKKPGRIPLTLARERVLDAIAIAGGSSNPAFDSIVKINRAGQSVEAPLSAIEPGSSDDVQLLPRDRLSVTFRPRTFTVLGATGKVAEIPFQNPRVSLVEAIGRSGGPSDERADPAAIYVFRYEPAEYDGSPAERSRPVAYRLNMRRPESYFLAQRFEMRPRDVIYMANAGANIPTKAIQVLSLFFSPFYTAKALSR